MRWPVFADADGVVGKDVDYGDFHDGAEAHGRFAVVAENKEGRNERAQFGERQTVPDRAHGVFADTEMEVAPAAGLRLEIAHTIECEASLGRGIKIGRATQQPGDVLGEG